MGELPTNIRWKILALMMAYAALFHFNRMSISVAGAEHIMQEYQLDEPQMGMVYSSYLVIYTLCMMPGGWLIDRYGPKAALMLVGFGSAIFVPLTGLTSIVGAGSILAALCVVRGMLGAISAPLHPGAARAVSFWIPYQGRSLANGLVTGAALVGIASTYFVFGYLMDQVGWPSAFLVAGIITLLLTIVWSLYATDRPAQHRGVNADELLVIDGDNPVRPSPDDPPKSISSSDPDGFSEPTCGNSEFENGPEPILKPFLVLLRNRSLVLLTISYAAYSYFQYLFFYWMQYYFLKVLEFSRDESRLYSTIPTVAMAVGMISGGWIADRVESHFGGSRGRAIVPVCAMVSSALLLMLGILGTQPVWVVICFSMSMGTLGATESTFWMTGVELGRKRGGLSGAFLNTVGNVGGLLAPVITPLFSSYFGWKAGLVLASVVCLAGAVLWKWIDPDEDPEAA